MVNLNEMVKVIHENADKHGWWEGKRSYGEITSLFHSELSEALEEYRAGRPVVWYADDGKPEGQAIELIDCVIRIFDFFGAVGATMKGFDTIDDAIHALPEKVKEDMPDMSFPDLLAFMHCQISFAYEEDGTGEKAGGALMIVCALAFYWIRLQGEDPEALLMKKHEFNVTRPYKHGGKVC